MLTTQNEKSVEKVWLLMFSLSLFHSKSWGLRNDIFLNVLGWIVHTDTWYNKGVERVDTLISSLYLLRQPWFPPWLSFKCSSTLHGGLIGLLVYNRNVRLNLLSFQPAGSDKDNAFLSHSTGVFALSKNVVSLRKENECSHCI